MEAVWKHKNSTERSSEGRYKKMGKAEAVKNRMKWRETANEEKAHNR